MKQSTGQLLAFFMITLTTVFFLASQITLLFNLNFMRENDLHGTVAVFFAILGIIVAVGWLLWFVWVYTGSERQRLLQSLCFLGFFVYSCSLGALVPLAIFRSSFIKENDAEDGIFALLLITTVMVVLGWLGWVSLVHDKGKD